MHFRPRALVFAVAVAAASMASCVWADSDGKGRKPDKPQVVTEVIRHALRAVTA